MTTQNQRGVEALDLDALVCDGCGSSRTMESLKADGYLGCCPERKMLTAKEWAKRAQAAEALASTLQAEVLGVIEPFAEAVEACDGGTHDDACHTWESPLAMAVTYGDFRALAALRDKLAGDGGSSGAERGGTASPKSESSCKSEGGEP
jgi:hypothetical protein